MSGNHSWGKKRRVGEVDETETDRNTDRYTLMFVLLSDSSQITVALILNLKLQYLWELDEKIDTTYTSAAKTLNYCIKWNYTQIPVY